MPVNTTWRFVIRLLVVIPALLTVLVLAAPGRSSPPPAHRAPASWVHGQFATCVRLRESHDGRDPNAGGNLYGVQSGDSRHPYAWARGVPRAEQDWIAYQLYLRYGVQPWRPYDGC